MTVQDAVSLLLDRFPILKQRVDDPDELSTTPHIAYSLLAAEVLENQSDGGIFDDVSRFVDHLANSGDGLLEELLVIDILEGIAQDPDLAQKLKAKISPKSAGFLESVEREFFGRNPH